MSDTSGTPSHPFDQTNGVVDGLDGREVNVADASKADRPQGGGADPATDDAAPTAGTDGTAGGDRGAGSTYDSVLIEEDEPAVAGGTSGDAGRGTDDLTSADAVGEDVDVVVVVDDADPALDDEVVVEDVVVVEEVIVVDDAGTAEFADGGDPGTGGSAGGPDGGPDGGPGANGAADDGSAADRSGDAGTSRATTQDAEATSAPADRDRGGSGSSGSGDDAGAPLRDRSGDPLADADIGHVFDQTNGVIEGVDGESDGTAGSDAHSAGDRR